MFLHPGTTYNKVENENKVSNMSTNRLKNCPTRSFGTQNCGNSLSVIWLTQTYKKPVGIKNSSKNGVCLSIFVVRNYFSIMMHVTKAKCYEDGAKTADGIDPQVKSFFSCLDGGINERGKWFWGVWKNILRFLFQTQHKTGGTFPRGRWIVPLLLFSKIIFKTHVTRWLRTVALHTGKQQEKTDFNFSTTSGRTTKWNELTVDGELHLVSFLPTGFCGIVRIQTE